MCKNTLLLAIGLLLGIAPQAQFGKLKSCKPFAVTFGSFEKNNVNIFTGAEYGSAFTRENYQDQFRAVVLVNYHPTKYNTELGLKLTPGYSFVPDLGRKFIMESNLYFRYYWLMHSCYKIGIFTGAGLHADNARYTRKNLYETGMALNGSANFGLLYRLGKSFRVELSNEFFVSKRPVRTNFSVLYLLNNFKPRKKGD